MVKETNGFFEKLDSKNAALTKKGGTDKDASRSLLQDDAQEYDTEDIVHGLTDDIHKLNPHIPNPEAVAEDIISSDSSVPEGLKLRAKTVTKDLSRKYFYDFTPEELKIMGYGGVADVERRYRDIAKKENFQLAHKHARDPKSLTRSQNYQFKQNRKNDKKKLSVLEKVKYKVLGVLPSDELVPNRSKNMLARKKYHYKFDSVSKLNYGIFKKTVRHFVRLTKKFKAHNNVAMETNYGNGVRFRSGEYRDRFAPGFYVKIGQRGSQVESLLAASPAFHLIKNDSRILYASDAAREAVSVLEKNFDGLFLQNASNAISNFFEYGALDRKHNPLILYVLNDSGILPQDHISNKEIEGAVVAMCKKYEEDPTKLKRASELQKFVYSLKKNKMATKDIVDMVRYELDEYRKGRPPYTKDKKNLRALLDQYTSSVLGKRIYPMPEYVANKNLLKNFLDFQQQIFDDFIKKNDIKSAIEKLEMEALFNNAWKSIYFEDLGGDKNIVAIKNMILRNLESRPKMKYFVEHNIKPICKSIARVGVESLYKKGERALNARDVYLVDAINNPKNKKNPLARVFRGFKEGGGDSGDSQLFVARVLSVWSRMMFDRDSITDPSDITIKDVLLDIVESSTGDRRLLESIGNSAAFSPAYRLKMFNGLIDSMLLNLGARSGENEFFDVWESYYKDMPIDEFRDKVLSVWNKVLSDQRVPSSDSEIYNALRRISATYLGRPDFINIATSEIKNCPYSVIYNTGLLRDGVLLKFCTDRAKVPPRYMKLLYKYDKLDNVKSTNILLNKALRDWHGVFLYKDLWKSDNKTKGMAGDFLGESFPIKLDDVRDDLRDAGSVLSNNHPHEHWARMVYELGEGKEKVHQMNFWYNDYSMVLNAQYPIVFYDDVKHKVVKIYPKDNNTKRIDMVANGLALSIPVSSFLKSNEGGMGDAIGTRSFVIEEIDANASSQASAVKKKDFEFSFYTDYQDYEVGEYPPEKMYPMLEWAQGVLRDIREFGGDKIGLLSNCHGGINRSQMALVLVDTMLRIEDMKEEFMKDPDIAKLTELEKVRLFYESVEEDIGSNILASITHITAQGNTMQYSQYRNVCNTINLLRNEDIAKAAQLDLSKAVTSSSHKKSTREL